MLRSSRIKSFALVLAVAAALFSCVLVVAARQKSEGRAPDSGARGRAEALRSPAAQKRAAAAYEISKRPGEPLIGALARKEPEARKNAAWALGVVSDRDKDDDNDDDR